MTDLRERQIPSESDFELGWSDRTPSPRPRPVSGLAVAAIVAAVAVAIGYVFVVMDRTPTTTNTDSVAAQPDTNQFTEFDADGTPFEGSFEESGISPIELTYSEVVRTADSAFITYRVFRDQTNDSFTTTAERSSDGETWEPATMTNLPVGKLMHVDAHGSLLVASVIDYSIDPNGKPQKAVSSDGLDWISIATIDSIPHEKWRSSTFVSDVAPLSDGRMLVAGVQNSVPDFDAFGFDSENVCSHEASIGEAGTMTLEVWACDDNSTESIAIPEPPINVTKEGPVNVTEARLWTVDGDGTNPVPVPMPQDDLVAIDGPLSYGSDMVTVQFALQENPTEAVYRGSTRDGASWDLEAIPAEDRTYPYRLASYGDTTFRTTTNADELAIQRSSDGGRTWTDIAPIDPEASVSELAVGPAGVALLAFANHDSPETDDFLRTPFDYRAADGTHLTGELPGAYTTWVLTTPTGEKFTYELAPSIQFPPGSDDEYPNYGESDPNVIVEFSSQGVPWYTVLSPVDGSTLLTLESGDLWLAADHDASIEPAADAFSGGGPVVFFSTDDGATWEALTSTGLKAGPIAVGDDEVLIANSSDDGTPTRIPVPTN